MGQMKLNESVELRYKHDDHMKVDSETKVPYERRVVFQNTEKKPIFKVTIDCLPGGLPLAGQLEYVKLTFVDPQKKVDEFYPKGEE